MRNTPAPIVAIDPGRDKCGVAVVDYERHVLYQAVVPIDDVAALLLPLAREQGISRVVVGDRTGTSDIIRRLRNAGLELDIKLVNEHLSSDEGRKRFFDENPPMGWRRLLPKTMLFPDRPYDDYVAIILAERFFNGSN